MTEELYELAAMLKRSPRSERILHVVAESAIPLGSGTISRKIAIWQPNVIMILKKLESKGAIREVANVRSGRMYVVTEKGKEALSMVKKFH